MNKAENRTDTGTVPYASGKEEGQAVWFLNALLVVKATGEQTGGAFGLMDHVLPAGWASPYHVHRNEEESFYVVEGETTFYVGDERVEAGPGAFVYGPREVSHGFAVEGNAPARVLLINTPAGFEGFPVEAGEPARELTLPPTGSPNLEKLTQIAATYDIEVLGPLPGR